MVVHAFKIAEVRDVNTIVKACLKQGGPFFGFDFFIVHQEFRHSLKFSLLLIRSPLNNGNQIRRRYLSDGIIFRRADHHAFTTLYTEFLINPLLSITGGKYGLNRATCGTGVAAAGA
jgi:hypothetical protein